VSHILAKALAEEAIANEGYQNRAEPFFNTRINKRAVKIRWKKEWWHKPVFRQTVKFLEGYEKSDDLLTAGTFDHNSNWLGEAVGLAERLSQYCYRRRFADFAVSKFLFTRFCVFSNTEQANYRRSVRDQTLRHKPDSSVYQKHHHNTKVNAAVRNAFLGRGTKSLYLAILNHIGLYCDENAPRTVPEEVVRAIGPDRTVRRLEEEMLVLKVALEKKYGKHTQAAGPDKEEFLPKTERAESCKTEASQKGPKTPSPRPL
jgi:hypothetical protein